MKQISRHRLALCTFFLLTIVPFARSSTLDTIGVTLLRTVQPALTGSGITVAQAEAPTGTNTPPPFEVRPSAAGQPVDLFTYISAVGTATASFPNTVGAESGHANSVGNYFYGSSAGVAPQVAHVDNYEANEFYRTIAATPSQSIPDKIANQSFISTGLSPSEQAAVEQDYDNYAASHGTLFVSGAGNSGRVYPPSTCFNGLSVAAYGGSSSTGPSLDGRSKPDITVPAGVTSYSTPYVAGAAAVLLQAANRGDGGPYTASAGDLRTLKALLLNGAVKPADWTNGVTTPLDARYGAGILNLYNSWNHLSAGQYSFIESTSNPVGEPHPPGTIPNNEPSLRGWDSRNISNSRVNGVYQEQVNHYYFNLNTDGEANFTLTATLVWNRRNGQTAINDLNLFLYDCANSNLVTCSTSLVDNVEHVFLPALPPGRYDLQVQKNSGNFVSSLETYSLAFEMFTLKLSAARVGNSLLLHWPIAPAGFVLQSNTNLTLASVWIPVTAAVTVSNSQNWVSVPTTAPQQFFRLGRP